MVVRVISQSPGTFRRPAAWMVANAVGQMIASAMTAGLIARLFAVVRPFGIAPEDADAIVTPVRLLVLGTTLGIAQWLILRTALRQVRWWLALTVAGALAAVPVQLAIDSAFRAGLHHKPTPFEALAWSFALGIALGLGVSAMQWLTLRTHFTNWSVWVAAGALGFGVGATLNTSLQVVGAAQVAAQLTGVDLLGGLVSGAVYGAATATAFVWLSERSR